jgi:CelD/BcsL family acetyltransferase involved in cellulose biosynthesis
MYYKVVTQLQDFTEIATEWNQLWLESNSHVALHRAEPLARFIETFGYTEHFLVLTVWDQQRLVLGLPLIIKRNRLGQRIACSTANEWFLQACLLKAKDMPPTVFKILAEALKDLGMFQTQLNWLPLEWPASQELTASWSEMGNRHWIKPRFHVSFWSVPEDWQTYWYQLNQKRRKKYLAMEKKLSGEGTIELMEYDGTDLEVFDQHFEQVLSVEHAGWKGRAGSSLTSHPSIARMYSTTYRELARLRLLRIYLLKVGGRAIAVDLGYLVNGVYSSQKVSYLEDYAKFSPGQLLNARLFERFHQTGEVKFIDCVGEVSAATAKWGTETYRSGQVTLSTPSLLSKASVYALNGLATMLGKNELADPTARLLSPSLK